MARGSSALGDPEKIRAIVNLSVLNHGRKFIDADAARWCCELAFSRPGTLDYLELLQGRAMTTSCAASISCPRSRGSPSKAISFANGIDASYKGYPYYAMERSRAEAQLAAGGSGTEKTALDKAYRENAFNAYYWEQGQSLVANKAHDQFSADGKEYYGHHDNLYYTDIPYRPYYWTWADGGNPQTSVQNKLAAFKNASSEIHTLSQLAEDYRRHPDKGQVSDLVKSIAGRFIDSPHRNDLLITEALLGGDGKAAQAYLRENIKLSPATWTSYHALGRLLLESGDVNAAAGVFRS